MSEKHGNRLTFSEPSDKLRDMGHFRSGSQVFLSFRRLPRGRPHPHPHGQFRASCRRTIEEAPCGPVGRGFEPGKGVWRKRRNEKAVKPLKTHKTAKSLIQWSK